MAIEDPVLQRDMFRSRKKDIEGAGIATVPSDVNEEGYNRRVEEAKSLFEQARVKQDPSNFQTLSEQEKPGVFRPIQSASAQAPQQNVQQQMAQMQAMGFRPVGMADGGYVKHFREGGVNTISPTISPANSAGSDTSLTPISDSPYSGLGSDPSQWSDADIENYASGIASMASPSELTRKIRTMKNIRDQARVNKSVTKEREITSEKEFPPVTPRTPMPEEEKAVIRRKTEQPDLPPVTDFPEETSAAQVAGGSGSYLSKVDEAIGIPSAQVAGGSGDYMSKLSSGTGISDAQVAGGSGDYMSKVPSGIAAPAPAPLPVSPATEASKSNVFDTYSTNLEQIKADRAAQRRENIGLALVQAGLAISGGTSPNALTNIGQGGISGLQAFAQGERESRTDYRQAMQDLRAEQAAKRDEAYRQRAIGLQEAAQKFKTETEFPETLRQRESAVKVSELSVIARDKADITNQIRDTKRQMKDISNNMMLPEADKKAQLEALQAELNDLQNRWDYLSEQAGYKYPERSKKPDQNIIDFGNLK